MYDISTPIKRNDIKNNINNNNDKCLNASSDKPFFIESNISIDTNSQNENSINISIPDNNITYSNKQYSNSPIKCARKLDFSDIDSPPPIPSTQILPKPNISTTSYPIRKSTHKIKLKCNCSECQKILAIVNGETILSKI